MKKSFKEISGSIVAPRGFLASGVFCDIKRLGTGKGSNKGRKRDLALIVSEVPAIVAGLFTTNQVCAPPVKVCIERVERGVARAIVVNSGNANACTGAQGKRDALAMTKLTALAIEALHHRRVSKSQGETAVRDRRHQRISADQVLVASTGRIGVTLPMTNVKRGIHAAAELLSAAAESAGHVTEAIMTSDTRPKEIAVEFELGGKTVRIGGICKGAGMIQPGMSPNGKRPAATPAAAGPTPHATMLCFITTDAAIEQKTLNLALTEAVANSFNRITVDGDMSTNDTALILANGLAGNPILTGRASVLASRGVGNSKLETRNSKFPSHGSSGASPSLERDLAVFQSALNHVCLELARMIVRDGEGVSRFVTVRLTGARSFADADPAARAVANSALVKTSWNGGDPNWGRIIDALGYSSAKVIEERVDIGYSAPGNRKVLWSLRRGQPTKVGFKDLCAAVAPKEFDLHINLNLGKASAVIYTADLTEEYVDFNKGDVSDPSSLGG